MIVDRKPQLVDNIKIQKLCQSYYVKKLSIFGSYMRNDFSPSSDIDMLVEFFPDHVPGLEFFLLEEKLSKITGRKVDLQTKKFLSPMILESVLSEARVIYEQA